MPINTRLTPAMAPALSPCVLLLPGWLNSGPGHWQSRWESSHGFERVEQADWLWPRRGDWMARVDDVLLAGQQPALRVAHSLGTAGPIDGDSGLGDWPPGLAWLMALGAVRKPT